jgi:lipopolysaccharide heptosyltransferase I
VAFTPPTLGPGARVLIVRLSALGDIIHATPVLAAIRRRYADVKVDWLVEAAYAPILSMVSGIHRSIVVRAERRVGANSDPVFAGGLDYARAVGFLRRQQYDAALDLQGLVKSALWARLSGARRVIGFDRSALREPLAARLYTETVAPSSRPHVIHRNLAVAAHLGAVVESIEVPIAAGRSSMMVGAVADMVGGSRYAVLNPGAAWPNKRWPADRFGGLAKALLGQYGLRSIVTWGPSERDLAEQIARESAGAAMVAPPTGLEDLAALVRGASLVVSGDTGPLHLAAAMGAPIVGLYGPTRPERNGPWDADDETISRAEECRCHHKRHCQIGAPCIDRIGLEEVLAAVERRLSNSADV